MCKKLISLLIFCLLTATNLHAQNGDITGKVVAEKNKKPIESVSVIIKNTDKGTNTNAEGYFIINNVTPGNYTLVISALGYQTLNVPVLVTEATTNLSDIVLKEKREQLKDVLVNGKSVNKYTKQTSVYVSKMPLKDIENPQVYNSIPQVLLSEQVVTNFDDALKNAPGIDKLWESTGRGGDGAGYFSVRGFAVQPTIVNGLPALTNGSPDPANIESIEVIKGPSGTLYGSSLISYGGLINITTKKPYYGFGGELSYIAGSYGLNRVTADVNTTLNEEKGVALRINTAYHTQNSFQDAGFKKSFFFAPSLMYQVTDKLSFHFNTEIYNGKSTNQTMLFVDRGNPLTVHNLDELDYNHKRSYTSNDLYIENPSYSLQGIMDYKISSKWTSQTVFSRSNSKSEGYYSYLYEQTTTAKATAIAKEIDPIDNGIILARFTSKQNSETLSTDIQQNFIGDFNIGNLRNRFVGGLDYYHTKSINNSTGYGNQGFIYLGSDIESFKEITPVLHENYGAPVGTSKPDDTGVLTQAGADAGIATLGNPGINYSSAEQEVYSTYISNVINFLPELSVMASLRIDHFKNSTYEQTALSPKFGIVYQPILNKVSLFANYMDGFRNLEPVTELENGVESENVLKPEHANQFEFGTKLNLFDGKLAATISYYDINVKDKSLRIDIDANNYYYSQDGEQESKGIEVSIITNPIEGLNIIAGYSYNESELIEGAASFKGFRPESAGPQNLANLWASYHFTKGALNNFGFGFGGNYASENKIFNRTNGTFTLDEYVILNASTFYHINDFKITLKLDNIANKEYYKGWSTISPQNLRSLSVNFAYRF